MTSAVPTYCSYAGRNQSNTGLLNSAPATVGETSWNGTSIRDLHKLATLPPRAWRVLLEILCVSVWVEFGLRVLSVRRLLDSLRQPPVVRRRDASKGRAMRVPELCRLANAVFRRYPFHLTCLKKALMLLILLRRRGVAVELNIGVTKAGGTFQAHAWLEHRGETLFDDPAIRDRFQAVLPVT